MEAPDIEPRCIGAPGWMVLGSGINHGTPPGETFVKPRTLTCSLAWQDARQLEDPRRRQVLVGHGRAEVCERVRYGVGERRRRDDGAAFAHTPEPELPVRIGFEMLDLDHGDLHGGREQVVHEGPGEEVALLIVRRVLVEHAADALRDTAPDLA